MSVHEHWEIECPYTGGSWSLRRPGHRRSYDVKDMTLCAADVMWQWPSNDNPIFISILLSLLNQLFSHPEWLLVMHELPTNGILALLRLIYPCLPCPLLIPGTKPSVPLLLLDEKK